MDLPGQNRVRRVAFVVRSGAFSELSDNCWEARASIQIGLLQVRLCNNNSFVLVFLVDSNNFG